MPVPTDSRSALACVSSRGPVEHEVGEEGVEVGEVPVQDAFGAARLVGDGPAGQPVRPVPQQHAFGGVEQLLPRVAKMHSSRHAKILSCVDHRHPLPVGMCPLKWAHAHFTVGATGPSPAGLHKARQMAESFGMDAQRYDQARPGYPDALVARIVAGSPGPDVLDVGCGTGIAARQFQAAGCAVLGVEPDARMADFARAAGPAGRGGDLRGLGAGRPDVRRGHRRPVVALGGSGRRRREGGAGAASRGRLAIFGHVYEPPAEVAEPFAAAYRRVAPDSPFSDQPARRPLDLYQAAYAKLADKIRETGTVRRSRTVAIRLGAVLHARPMAGSASHHRRPHPESVPNSWPRCWTRSGRAIDSLGGRFTMRYTTLATTALRASSG